MTDHTPTLDELVSRDPLDLSSQDIDLIVAHQRKAMSNFEAGIKPKREAGPKQALDLGAALNLHHSTNAPEGEKLRRI